MKKLILFIIFFISLSGIGMSDWYGPTVIVEGEWGSADNQFGLARGDTFDEHASLDGILGDGSIVISDLVNKRTLVFKSDGIFKEKENWIEQPIDKGMIRYAHNKYLLGCCVQGYDANGNLWTGGDNNYALTNKDGILLSKVTTRPLELGKVTKEKIASNQYKVKVKYPDKEWSIVGKGAFPNYIRDLKGNLYGIGETQVTRYDNCGKELARFTIPQSDVKEIPRAQEQAGVEPIISVAEEYGSPVLAPNGDVYAWKRTPDTYSIIKWTWQDDPNVPSGPDAPTGLAVMPSISGLYLTWSASPQDPGCVSGYEITRATSSGGVYTSLATVDKGVLKYNETTAEAGTTYYYRVRAVSGTDYSPYTSEVSGKR